MAEWDQRPNVLIPGSRPILTHHTAASFSTSYIKQDSSLLVPMFGFPPPCGTRDSPLPLRSWYAALWVKRDNLCRLWGRLRKTPRFQATHPPTTSGALSRLMGSFVTGVIWTLTQVAARATNCPVRLSPFLRPSLELSRDIPCFLNHKLSTTWSNLESLITTDWQRKPSIGQEWNMGVKWVRWNRRSAASELDKSMINLVPILCSVTLRKLIHPSGP